VRAPMRRPYGRSSPIPYPGLSARLILDERATHAEASEAILGTLAHADHDDVVVITFAGHGSPDGNLVLFDTDPADSSIWVPISAVPSPTK
jgi:hypothetical protein